MQVFSEESERTLAKRIPLILMENEVGSDWKHTEGVLILGMSLSLCRGLVAQILDGGMVSPNGKHLFIHSFVLDVTKKWTEKKEKRFYL